MDPLPKPRTDDDEEAGEGDVERFILRNYVTLVYFKHTSCIIAIQRREREYYERKPV